MVYGGVPASFSFIVTVTCVLHRLVFAAAKWCCLVFLDVVCSSSTVELMLWLAEPCASADAHGSGTSQHRPAGEQPPSAATNTNSAWQQQANASAGRHHWGAATNTLCLRLPGFRGAAPSCWRPWPAPRRRHGL